MILKFLKEIDNKILKKGLIKLKFENNKLLSDDKILYLNDFAFLEIKNFEYLEDNDQILQMNIKVNIVNKEKFNRFLFNYKKNKILSENLYFTYQYNVNSLTNFII